MTNLQLERKMERLRKKIDRLDRDFIGILSERQKCSVEIAKIKKQLNLPVLQMERWQKLISQRIHAGKKKGLSALMIQRFFEVFHQESLAIQKEIIDKSDIRQLKNKKINKK